MKHIISVIKSAIDQKRTWTIIGLIVGALGGQAYQPLINDVETVVKDVEAIATPASNCQTADCAATQAPSN